MMIRLENIGFLRRVTLPVLRRLKIGDIQIKHHWTKAPLTLDFFRHKGYWYHGRRREQETMDLFAALLRPGDFAVEVGAHIGYVSLYLAHLVGPGGKVLVFEPAPDNLKYLRRNTVGIPAISIVESAVTDYTGTARFHVETLTGQNNSLLDDYAVRKANEDFAYAGPTPDVVMEVPCTRLADHLEQAGLPSPALIKIDVEGAEYSVLRGMSRTLELGSPALMVEVSEQSTKVLGLLREAGYSLFLENKQELEGDLLPGSMCNIFAVKPGDQRIAHFR